MEGERWRRGKRPNILIIVAWRNYLANFLLSAVGNTEWGISHRPLVYIHVCVVLLPLSFSHCT